MRYGKLTLVEREDLSAVCYRPNIYITTGIRTLASSRELNLVNNMVKSHKWATPPRVKCLGIHSDACDY